MHRFFCINLFWVRAVFGGFFAGFDGDGRKVFRFQITCALTTVVTARRISPLLLVRLLQFLNFSVAVALRIEVFMLIVADCQPVRVERTCEPSSTSRLYNK